MILEKSIKRLTLFMILGLFLSGLSAIPFDFELYVLHSIAGEIEWVQRLIYAIFRAEHTFPSAFYATDWLAFAHFVLAFLYVGFYRNPIKNEWLIQFGLIISLAVIPYAFVFGYFRDIPIWWRCLDCSFGIVAFFIFYRIHFLLKKLKSII